MKDNVIQLMSEDVFIIALQILKVLFWLLQIFDF